MTKVKEEQLSAAREIRAKQQQIQMELGALYVSSLDIVARQEALTSELRASGEEIKELMGTLEEEYGTGSLNLETGEFTTEGEAQMEVVK